MFDYIFLVRFLNATNYYKFDVYLYYTLTFVLPVIVGSCRFFGIKKGDK
jgi:hypothetical protein